MWLLLRLRVLCGCGAGRGLQRMDSGRPADAALPPPPGRRLGELFAVLGATLEVAGGGSHASTWDRCVILSA